ncbi:P-loop containing nucleoside triphosphate hydrolase protein [Lactarius akahatsu]|uniref:P-loop containing nucleoside triphosphate hydrolase protein n=1 Tax=Lactarius akahatsu TaxID=416441 RepID=A0AAD4LSM5_9AGAM|nr:P-loop containing nucleoside triphosphate hydrolase protein [Lactarius akahatsu]
MSRCFFTGGLVTVSDVLFSPVYDVSQKCRLAPQAVQEIFDAIAHAINHPPSLLRDVIRDGSETITSGDVNLDKMLGGGIRVGMIWELVGEGRVFAASGKTQLALQLSLLVQLPVAQGGLNGSACYLTTSTGLPTPRLIELLHEHPLLVGSHCTLDNIQTSVTKSVDSLLYALSEVLPALMDAANARSMPLKLLVIDSLAELLLEDKVSTASLADRSRNLSAIAAQLHALAATRQLAVLAINRVTDVWERRPDADPGTPGELIYAEHARIFGRAEGASKSAALGLVWANQINARVFLARTARRYALPAEKSRDRKRQRTEGAGATAAIVRADDVVVRRLSVVFSAVCAPAEVDFIITFRGVETCADDAESGGAPGPAAPSAAALALATNVVRPPLAEVSPLDVGSVVSDLRPPLPGDEPVGEAEDDEEAYWRDMDDFTAFGEGIDLL